MADGKTSLPGPIDLLKESWKLFTSRWKTILGIYFVGLVLFAALILFLVLIFGLGVAGLFAFNQLNGVSLLIAGLVVLVVLVVLFLVGTWWQAALLLSYVGTEKKLTFSECFKEGKQFIAPLITTSLLTGLISFGGFFVFFLPGLLFSIWFTFSQLIVVDHKLKNFPALQTSREYFRGRFFPILWRMIAIYIPFFVVGLLLGTLGDSDAARGLHGIVNVLSFIVGPFLGFYCFVLYKHLKALHPVVKEVPKNSKLLYLGVAIAGFIMMFLVGGALISAVSSLMSQASESNQLQEESLNVPPGYEIPQGTQDLSI